MRTVRKYLVYGYVPVMVKEFRNDNQQNCIAQRSINIVLRGNEETRRYIQKVRNVQGIFNSYLPDVDNTASSYQC